MLAHFLVTHIVPPFERLTYYFFPTVVPEAEVLSYRTKATTGDKDEHILQSPVHSSWRAKLQHCFQGLQWTVSSKTWHPCHNAFHFVFTLIEISFLSHQRKPKVVAGSFPFICFILVELLMCKVAVMGTMPQRWYSNNNGIGALTPLRVVEQELPCQSRSSILWQGQAPHPLPSTPIPVQNPLTSSKFW